MIPNIKPGLGICTVSFIVFSFLICFVNFVEEILKTNHEPHEKKKKVNPVKHGLRQ